MASYIPGVTDTGFDPVQFTPNFPYTQNALQKVSGRYEQNFNKVASGYMSILNAPLTNEQHIKSRDEYLKQAKEQLKNITSSDLSLESNVEQASNIFAPFWEDKHMLADMADTKMQAAEEQRQLAIRDSIDPNVKETFSEIPLILMQQRREKIRTAAPDDLSVYNKQPVIKSTPFYNRGKEFQKWLKETGYSIDTTRTENGNIYTVKNGPTTVGTYSQVFREFAGNKFDSQDRVTGEYLKLEGIRGIQAQYQQAGIDISEEEATQKLPEFYRDKLINNYNASNKDILEKKALLQKQMDEALASGDRATASIISKNAEDLAQSYSSNNSQIDALKKPSSQEFAALKQNLMLDPAGYFARITSETEGLRAAQMAANNTSLKIDQDDSFWKQKTLEQDWAKHQDDKDVALFKFGMKGSGTGGSRSGLGMGSGEKPNGDTDQDGIINQLDGVVPTVNIANNAVRTQTVFQTFENKMNNLKTTALGQQADILRSGSPQMSKLISSQEADILYSAVKNNDYGSPAWNKAYTSIKEKLKNSGVDISGIKGPYGIINAVSDKYLNDVTSLLETAEKNPGNKEINMQAQQEVAKVVGLQNSRDVLNNVFTYEQKYKDAVTSKLSNPAYNDIRMKAPGGGLTLISPQSIATKYNIPIDLATSYVNGDLKVKKDPIYHYNPYDVNGDGRVITGYNYYINDGEKDIKINDLAREIGGDPKEVAKKLRKGLDNLNSTISVPDQNYFKQQTGEMGKIISYNAVENKMDVADQIAKDLFTGNKIDMLEDEYSIVAPDDDSRDAAKEILRITGGDPTYNLTQVNLYPISPGNPSKRAIGLKYNSHKFSNLSKAEQEVLQNFKGEVIVELKADANVSGFPSVTDSQFYDLILSNNDDPSKPAIKQSDIEEKAGVRYSMYKTHDNKIMFNVGYKSAIVNKDTKEFNYKWVDAINPGREYQETGYSEMPPNVSIDEFIKKLRTTSVDNMTNNYNMVSSVVPTIQNTITEEEKKKLLAPFNAILNK